MSIRTFRLGPVEFASGIYAAAAPFIVAGLAISDPNVRWVSALSYIAAAGLVLWGTTVNRRRLWEPWWRGPPNPFKLKTWSVDWKYQEGSDVAGIRWQKGFAHVRVNLTNISGFVLEDVTVRLRPDQPIIQSRATCKFAECRLESEFELRLAIAKPLPLHLPLMKRRNTVCDGPSHQHWRVNTEGNGIIRR